METKAVAAFALPLLVLLLMVYSTAGRMVTVYPQNCTEERRDDNVILNGEVQSNTAYQLLDGVHCILNFSLVQDKSNLTFVGNSTQPERVVVECVATTGLGFVGVSALTLEWLTVSGCGVTGENNLRHFQSKFIQRNIDFFYDLQQSDVIAILVGLVSNFTVRGVTVNATKGLGMLAVNPQGSTVIQESTFSGNHPLSCYRLPIYNNTIVNITDESNFIGGGAYFVLLNVNGSRAPASLTIHNSTFLKNSYCGLQAVVALNYRVAHMVSEVGYSLGAGGGLSVVLAQTQYPAQVVVSSTTFQNNTSYLGGGAYIAMYEGVSGNNIAFVDCHFLKNGLAENLLTVPRFYTSGSGLAVVKDLTFPIDQEDSLNSKPLKNYVLLRGCTLSGNRASYSGAINVYSLYGSPVHDTVVLDNCTLSENEAIVGAAMYFGELKQNGLQPGIQLVMDNVIVTRNRIIFEDSTDSAATISKSDSSAAIELQSINITFRGNSSLISNNYATAIRSMSSVIYIDDHLVMCNNSGSFGGGMNLIAASYVVLKNNSHLRLENNTGVVEGGAIYVNLLAYSPDFSYHDCFLFFQEVETVCFGPSSCSNVTSLNFKLELVDNTSPLGSLIFGSTLDTCPWSLQLKDLYNKPISYPVLDIMYQMKEKFDFSSSPTTVSAVTTPSNKLLIHDPELERNYAPGELFHLNISGYDHLDQSTPVLVSSKPSTSIRNISSILGFSNFSFLEGGYGESVPVIVMGGENVTNITIYLYATDSYTQIAFQVNLTECAVGFEYCGGRCVCEEGLSHRDIECNATSMTLTVPNNQWVGPGPHGSLIISPCVSDFCSPGEREVKPPLFDSLCRDTYNRSGILCGACVEGFSITLGSHRCMDCTNSTLSLIIFFALAGIFIIFGILFLRITVSDGYLNSLLFYTNILSIYIPILNSTSKNASIFVIVAWFNLDYGIEQCFYDGMTTLTRVALRLVFPSYLLLLMFLIILLSKKSKRLSKFFSRAQFSAAKLFATVLLMSYATILEVCLELLSPISLKSVDGQWYVMWRSDPNQIYFEGLHIPLMIMACILLVTVVLPAPILLMFPGIAFSTRLGVKIKPVLDAFWAPFKTRFRFYVGFRLLLRVIPYSTAYLTSQPMNILFLGMFSASLLLLQVVIQPFDGFLRNSLDCFFLVNVVMVVMGALYFLIFITEHQENGGYVKYNQQQFIYFTLFVTTAYLAFLAVILWHLHSRFPSIQRWITSLVDKIKTGRNKKASIDIGETTPIMGLPVNCDNVSLNSEDPLSPWPTNGTGITTPHSWASSNRATQPDPTPDSALPPPVVNYSELREPLLEEGLADLVPVTS